MHDIEASVMPFPMRNDTHTTHVASAGRHGYNARIEADEVGDLPGREIDLDGIIDLDRGIRITDPTTPATQQPRQSMFSPPSDSSTAADQPKQGPTTER